jgi:hypothetical protein
MPARQQEHHGEKDSALRHVAKESEGQGERTREMAEDLDDEEERDQHQLEGKVDRAIGEQLGAQQRPGEVLEIREKTDLAYADHVIGDEDNEGARDGRVEVAGGRHQSRDQPEQIRDEDVEPERRDQREIPAALMADHVVEQREELLEHHFHEVLRPRGTRARCRVATKDT